jgi:uncharacterized protein YbcI
MNKFEAEFSNIVRAFRKRFMGKGPSQVRTTFCKNWAICELEGNLSPIEKFMATSEDGKQMLRSTRTEMVKNIYKNNHPHEMEELLGVKFVRVFVDIDIENDMGMSIFVFDDDIENKFKQ